LKEAQTKMTVDNMVTVAGAPARLLHRLAALGSHKRKKGKHT
jgi:hypothetical protein